MNQPGSYDPNPFYCTKCKSACRLFMTEHNTAHASEYYCEKCHLSYPLDGRNHRLKLTPLESAEQAMREESLKPEGE